MGAVPYTGQPAVQALGDAVGWCRLGRSRSMAEATALYARSTANSASHRSILETSLNSRWQSECTIS
jgi:hypothetical protein